MRTNYQTSKETAISGLSEQNIQQALCELIRAFGHDPNLITGANLQEIADRLSEFVAREKPWGWKYLANVIHGSQMASSKLGDAILRLGATFDGLPAEIASAHQVQIMATVEVHPGSLLTIASRRCKNPACPIHFIPRSWNQKYHSAECRGKDKVRK